MTSHTHNTAYHVVIVGGGAGGLELATRLGDKLGRRKRAEITLVDATLTHLWKPLLHEVAAGTLNSNEDELNYLSHARAHYFRFRIGRLDGLNRAAKQVHLAATLDENEEIIVPARTLNYDTLIIAVGSTTHDFGIRGVQEHCLFLDSRQQADMLHRHLLRHFYSVSTQEFEIRASQLHIAIAGAGATGVELAAELRQAIREMTRHDIDRLIDEHMIRITLIEGAKRILPALPSNISSNTEKILKEVGVDVMVGDQIVEATADGFHMQSGALIAAETMVWAAGIKAPECLRNLDGLEVNSRNQLRVRPTLQTTLDDDIFALGDCASCPLSGKLGDVPPRAQAAHQQAELLYQSITRRIADKPLAEYRYVDYGSLVNLSRFGTVGNLMGNLRGRSSSSVMIEGWLARLAYLMLYKMHQHTLHGLRWVILFTLANWLTRASKPRLKLH